MRQNSQFTVASYCIGGGEKIKVCIKRDKGARVANTHRYNDPACNYTAL